MKDDLRNVFMLLRWPPTCQCHRWLYFPARWQLFALSWKIHARIPQHAI